MGHACAQTEVLALLVKGSAEAGGGVDVPKPAHGVIALFDTPMVLLEPIIEIGTATVGNVLTQCLADGTRIGVVAVGPLCVSIQ